MNSNKLRFTVLIAIALLVIATVILALVTSPGSGAKRMQRLADGSTLEIRHVAFTTNYSYSHQGGGQFARLLSPILPAVIKNRFWRGSGGSFGFGSDGSTNLFVITVNRSSAASWWSGLTRLVVFDDLGNAYDACWGANTIGMPGEVVHGWQLRAFPRRSETLGLRFIGQAPDGSWIQRAEFRIRNPAYKSYPQWSPAPPPVTGIDGDLGITLGEFQSGDVLALGGTRGDEQTRPRKTRAVFQFSRNGQRADNWGVQKITISDATGNRWFPYFGSPLAWSTNGTVEFLGALWPGEEAWKLDVECVRTRGFDPEELWESPTLTIPTVGVVTNLSASFQRDDLTVHLVGLAAPQADQPDPFKWIAKYWGTEDKDKIISLAVRISPELGKRRLTLVSAVDQEGREVKFVEHRNQDYSEQALLLRPADGATGLKLAFTLQRSRFVQFLARPDLVGAAKGRGH